jgi:hypothetical protein
VLGQCSGMSPDASYEETRSSSTARTAATRLRTDAASARLAETFRKSASRCASVGSSDVTAWATPPRQMLNRTCCGCRKYTETRSQPSRRRSKGWKYSTILRRSGVPQRGQKRKSSPTSRPHASHVLREAPLLRQTMHGSHRRCQGSRGATASRGPAFGNVTRRSGDNLPLMIFMHRSRHRTCRDLQCVVPAIVGAAILTVLTGCGGSSGRVGAVHGVPGAWTIWIPPSGRQLYVRIPEPVATGLGPPCPGWPWGLVNRYRLDRDGEIVYPPGSFPRDQHEAALERAVKAARDGSKPPWMKAFDKRCGGR